MLLPMQLRCWQSVQEVRVRPLMDCSAKRNDDPRKKLKFGWRLVDHENGHFTGVDTSVPNRALRAALQDRRLPEFAMYETVRPEVKYGQSSRIDFLLSQSGLPDAYLEVKSVTLADGSRGLFPDSVTERGTRHVETLARLARGGERSRGTSFCTTVVHAPTRAPTPPV